MANLIKNALKFTKQGKVEIGLYRDSEYVVYYVSDTGPGIEQDKLETIFDRFVQGTSNLSRGYEGSGVGLSIVKAYARALKEPMSSFSQGTQFSRFTDSACPFSPK